MDSSVSSAPGATYTRFTVLPLPISLPSERVKPSSARWATRSWLLPVSSGTVPSTTTRAFRCRLRISGVKNCCRASRSVEEVMPVASKARPLYFSPSLVVPTLLMPRLSSATVSCLDSRPLPPVTTVPSTRGAPSVQRSSLVGLGSPRFLTNSCPTGLEEKDW